MQPCGLTRPAHAVRYHAPGRRGGSLTAWEADGGTPGTPGPRDRARRGTAGPRREGLM